MNSRGRICSFAFCTEKAIAKLRFVKCYEVEDV